MTPFDWVRVRLLLLLHRRLPAQQLADFLDSLRGTRQGVAGCTWGDQPDVVIRKLLPTGLQLESGQANQHQLWFRGQFRKWPFKLMFYFPNEESGFRILNVEFVRTRFVWPELGAQLTFGLPVSAFPMPSAIPGRPEIHTVFVRNGLELVLELTPFSTGGMSLSQPRLSASLAELGGSSE